MAESIEWAGLSHLSVFWEVDKYWEHWLPFGSNGIYRFLMKSFPLERSIARKWYFLYIYILAICAGENDIQGRGGIINN